MGDDRPMVFIVDDDQAVRDSLSMLVDTVGLRSKAYATAAEFLDDYRPDQSGCLVADVRMPGMNGLELQACLADRGIAIPVVIITGHGDVHMAVQALKAGAVDFVEKPFRDQELLDSIQRAITSDAKLRSEQSQRDKVRGRQDQLTEREREVMELLIRGKSNKEVGAELGISRKTVDFHRVRILEKMGANSLVELVLMMQRTPES